MVEQILKPSLDLLRQEYVLVQAWKKTANYIRYHNWYSDTLELDRTSVNLPQFLGELGERLQAPESWTNDSLRIVPAPKSQRWQVRSDGNVWEPVEKGKTASKLRPLAHVSLMDQVAATAVMLCIADRVETLQSDPRDSVQDPSRRTNLTSYGNRLFCDKVQNQLRRYRSTFRSLRPLLGDRADSERMQSGEQAASSDDRLGTARTHIRVVGSPSSGH